MTYMPRFITFLFLFSIFVGPKCLFAQDDHTPVDKGLAIETSGSMGVFNETYNIKKAVLNELILPAIKDTKLVDAVLKYKKRKQNQRTAKYILSTLYTDVFTKDSMNFIGSSVNNLREALTPDPNTKKFSFNSYTSSLVYLEALEDLDKDIPVVLLNCPEYALIRWKFISDGSYIDWETTSGFALSKEDSKKYADNCTEVVQGSDEFYALFYFQRGHAEFILEDYTGAIAAYNIALELGPEDPLIYGARGSAEYALGDYAGAITDLNKFIELDPKNELASVAAILIKFAKDKLEESETEKK